MIDQKSRAVKRILDSLIPLPFDGAHWKAVFKAMRLSPRQADIVELIIRDATAKQIEIVLGIKESSIDEQRDRITLKIGTRTKMQIAMHVLVVSHQVRDQRSSS